MDVPKFISLMTPAFPNFSSVISSNLGIILAPVAIAKSSISTPPTHLTAGKLLCIRRWLASSSKPHWHKTILAPESFTFLTISTKYYCSIAYSFSQSSADLISRPCLVFGFGGSNGQVKIHTLASLISFVIYGCEKSLSSTITSMNALSSRAPPALATILIKSKFTSFLSMSATCNTAWTAKFAQCSWHYDTTLEPRAVIAHFLRQA